MSRFTEGDYDDEYWMLHQGRWEHNVRQALRSRRGRKALAEMREALLALPEPRLVTGAMCTVGGVDAKLPALTDAEVRAIAERERARVAAGEVTWTGEDWGVHMARCEREAREAERERFAEEVRDQGDGVCLIGAFLWHRKVRDGADPDEAFASLPALTSSDSGDPLHETAELGKDAGLAYTLAWELAYRNDETYRRMTPEERYTAFLAWIDGQLAEQAAA
jgi:hypothetical protein